MNTSRPLSPIQVSIKQCQSIESLDFEIHGFTCITGKSNIGKSAVVRSIASAILNSPVGSLVRKGSKFCSVSLKSENWEFKWEKGTGISRYYIPIDQETPLDKVGAGQIEPIAKMGFQSVSLGRDVTYPWYATQFDPLFLLTQSGATVTDFISEVSRLQVLQEAISISTSGRKKALDEAKVRAKDLGALKEKAGRVANLSQLEKVAQELEGQAESIREYERRVLLSEEMFRKLELGKSILLSVESVDQIKIPKDKLSDVIQKLRVLVSLHKNLVASAQKVIVLKSVVTVKIPEFPIEDLEKLHKSKKFETLDNLRASVSILEPVANVKIKTKQNQDLGAQIEKLKTGTTLAKKLENLTSHTKTLSSVVSIPELPPNPNKLVKMVRWCGQINSGEMSLESLEQQLSKTQKNLADIESEIKKIPNCPTCNRVASLDHMKSHKKTSHAVS